MPKVGKKKKLTTHKSELLLKVENVEKNLLKLDNGLVQNKNIGKILKECQNQINKDLNKIDFQDINIDI